MISIAGGEDVAGPPGLSRPRSAGASSSGLDPDVVIAMPCGWYVEDSRAQAMEHWERIEALGATARLRGRRRLDLLAARAAPGRRGRAARAICSTRTWSTRRATSASPSCGHPSRRSGRPAEALRRPRSRRAIAITPSAPSPQLGRAGGRRRACPARRRGSQAAQRTPATSPPRWAPMLIPGTPKLIARLSRISTPTLERARRRPGPGRSRRLRRRRRRPLPKHRR